MSEDKYPDIIHISTDPMYTDGGMNNKSLPLCMKGNPMNVGSIEMHYAGDLYRDDGEAPFPTYSLVNLCDGKGWWKDFKGTWCKECYSIARRESDRIKAMLALGDI